MVFKKKETKEVFEKAVDPIEVSKKLTKDQVTEALNTIVKDAVVDNSSVLAKAKRKKEDMKMLTIVLGPIPNDRFEDPKVGSVNDIKYKIPRGVKTEVPRIIVRHLEEHYITEYVKVEGADGPVAHLMPRKVYEQVQILNPEATDLLRIEKLVEKKAKEYAELRKRYS